MCYIRKHLSLGKNILHIVERKQRLTCTCIPWGKHKHLLIIEETNHRGSWGHELLFPNKGNKTFTYTTQQRKGCPALCSNELSPQGRHTRAAAQSRSEMPERERRIDRKSVTLSCQTSATPHSTMWGHTGTAWLCQHTHAVLRVPASPRTSNCPP